MTKRSKAALLVLSLLLLAGAAVLLFCSNQEGFTGSCIKNPDAYLLDIEWMNGTAVYRGNGRETTDFLVNIREDGVYTVVVEARRAKGTIHIQLEEETA